MKKYLILTSVLALAACGGGGGGDGGPILIPEANRITAQDRASNANVTSMVSEIGIAPNGSSIILARGATGLIEQDGVQYRAYRLDDADFETITTIGDTDDLKFTVDKNGRIDGIQLINDSNCTGPNCPPNIYRKMVRDGNTNKFQIAPDANGINGTAEYISYGKALGLQYADFGVVHIDGTWGAEQRTYDKPFAGGYDIKEIDDDDIAASVTFTGTAKGSVAGKDAQFVNIEDKSATLAFDRATGSETLNANFDNWYNMRVVKDNTDHINVTFDDTGKAVAENVKFATQPTANLVSGFNGPQRNEAVVFETNYYGDGANPSESTALFQYQQAQAGANDINVTVGFGGKK